MSNKPRGEDYGLPRSKRKWTTGFKQQTVSVTFTDAEMEQLKITAKQKGYAVAELVRFLMGFPVLSRGRRPKVTSQVPEEG